ncbi:hypothetical protein TNCV_553171 [Trichonephila clavipes]|nr:hypothetical protein TNCV_553171 [Trichonephila clavipes]
MFKRRDFMPINQSWRRKTSPWRLSILPVNILHILAEAGVIEMKATLLQMNANETSFQKEGEEKNLCQKADNSTTPHLSSSNFKLCQAKGSSW